MVEQNCCDLRRVAGLLAAELVAREAEHRKAARAQRLLQRLEALVLRRESALARGVDDQQHLTLEPLERNSSPASDFAVKSRTPVIVLFRSIENPSTGGIDRRRWGAAGFDRLAGGEAEILAVAAGDDLDADRNPADQTGGTVSPGSPMKGMAICVNCACHTRPKETSSLVSSWSGNGNSPDTGITSTAYFSKELQPFAGECRAPGQGLRKRIHLERKHLAAIAAQAGQRAGIAFTFGGGELRFIAIAEPEFGLQLRGLAQRRQRLDLLDHPSGLLQPLAGIGDGGLYFGDGIRAHPD